jgi:fibronectin type 3 domain-containing protein
VHLPGEAARREATNLRMVEEAFYQESKRAAVLSTPDIAERSRGASVVFRDPLSALWSQGAGADPIAYAVVSVRRNGERSPVSNIVVITPAVAPEAPVLVAAIPEEGRVCLEWLAPEKDVLGQPVHIGGYRIYRRNLSEPEYAAALNLRPVTGTTYVDTTAPYGVPVVYTLRATVENNPRVEGLPAEELPFLFRDVFPPPAPTRLDALSEGSLVRLLWDPVDAPDLAGYLVFRAEGTAAPVRLTKDPLAEPFYTDEHVAQGKRYRYTVRSVDRAGNESPPGPEAVAEPF